MTGNLVPVARLIATRAHAGQTDKAGNPYIEHAAAVAAAVAHLGWEAEAAGWLHDVIEDTDWTLGDLTVLGIPDAVTTVVYLLTRREGVLSGAYYAAIRSHPVALAVKLADVDHNTDPDRLALLEPHVQARLRGKYAHARLALQV